MLKILHDLRIRRVKGLELKVSGTCGQVGILISTVGILVLFRDLVFILGGDQGLGV